MPNIVMLASLVTYKQCLKSYLGAILNISFQINMFLIRTFIKLVLQSKVRS